MGIQSQLTDINLHFERVKIRARGKKLSLRGTFPPKPGDGHARKHYELALGCSATPTGLKLAKAKAQEIDSLLVLGKFDWESYLEEKPIGPRTVRDWVENDAIAIYGLRPHEVFRARGDRLNETPALLEVEERTKTGWRLVFPIVADFWEFDAKAIELPEVQVEGKNNNQLGMKVSQEFREAGVGFPPYNLAEESSGFRVQGLGRSPFFE